ncbi:hypothetical protein LptCag_1991 [Leptospirillum ferriphilum]|uniref:Uncharacterized protein n=1 Tax=Leptospirillum ferriphilum TaxID=178606 RepID=A0A094YMX7_9BACT|nr:hypothetical protein LptCag_1991 [Leptospirillum ferriphilum]
MKTSCGGPSSLCFSERAPEKKVFSPAFDFPSLWDRADARSPPPRETTILRRNPIFLSWVSPPSLPFQIEDRRPPGFSCVRGPRTNGSNDPVRVRAEE